MNWVAKLKSIWGGRIMSVELEEKFYDLHDKIRELEHELEKKEFEIEDWKEEVEELKQKIYELERISEELEKRPVVYCYRNKHGDLARHFGSWSLALWATPEEQKPTNPELDWKIEVYTGSNNHDRTKTHTWALDGLF